MECRPLRRCDHLNQHGTRFYSNFIVPTRLFLQVEEFGKKVEKHDDLFCLKKAKIYGESRGLRRQFFIRG